MQREKIDFRKISANRYDEKRQRLFARKIQLKKLMAKEPQLFTPQLKNNVIDAFPTNRDTEEDAFSRRGPAFARKKKSNFQTPLIAPTDSKKMKKNDLTSSLYGKQSPPTETADQTTDSTQTESDTSDQRSKYQKFNPFVKAMKEREARERAREKEREMWAEERKVQETKKKEYYVERAKQRHKLGQTNRKGQPNLRAKAMHLYEKLQKSLQSE